MVKTIHLVRHGHHALVAGVLCGRTPGIELDELGCRQMSLCARRILPRPCAIQCSPQRRAQQSAGILGWHLRLPVEIVAAVDELDCGDWTGRCFDELAEDCDWQRWNRSRGTSRPPNGESMSCLQRRMVQHIEQLRGDRGDGAIVIVSHAEPIRAALLHYADVPLDDFLSIAVDPASISTLCIDRAGVHISGINQRVDV
ncbi:MAG TPA: histidine phosphatase family protein [Bradyrhizobium sp.]|nr:histidine phosphatase family protein [Bradyrhizobium sp.]